MFGLRFMKTTPTTYVLHYRNGKLRREGAGLSFIYYAPRSTIVSVPLESADLPFVFNEVSGDFQELTIQGQLSYRVVDPKRLAELLDYSINRQGRHESDDPELLGRRLVNATRALTRSSVQALALRDALVSLEQIEREVRSRLANHPQVEMLGVEILDVSLFSAKPTPEMAKALEAHAREQLQRESDAAIYQRRNAAVELERSIKENELNTELVVQQKRAAVVDRKVANDRKEADGRAYALSATLEPVRELDWKRLMALFGQGGAPLMIASAFRELAENTEKIGELNITPELLRSLIAAAEER